MIDDDEINRLVGERVMGRPSQEQLFERLNVLDKVTRCAMDALVTMQIINDWVDDPPDYCNSFEAMGELIEKFDRITIQDSMGSWSCNGWIGGKFASSDYAKSIQKAVALAALKSKGISVEN